MVTPPFTGTGVDIHSRRRKNPMPCPLPPGIRIFPRQRRRKLNPAGACLDIFLMQLPDPFDVTRQVILKLWPEEA
jgi:hypothetical protein